MSTTTTAAAGEKKGKGRRNGIGGYLVDSLVREVMIKVIADNKIELGFESLSAVTDDQIALAMTVYFQEHTDKDDLCECEKCLGISPDDLPACPFCGFAGNVGEGAPTPAKVSSAVKIAGGGGSPELDGDDPTETATVDTKKAGAKKTKPTKAEETTTMTTTNGVHAPPITALTRPKKGGGLTSATDLDKAVAEVIALKVDTLRSYHALAHRVRELNQKNLWKLRVDEDGKPRYQSWDAFVHSELHMTPAYSWELITAAGNFTELEMAKMGHTKAILVLKAAPEDKERLKLAALEGKATKEQLREEVRESRKKAGLDEPAEPTEDGTVDEAESRRRKRSAAGKKSGESRKKKAAGNAVAKVAKVQKDKITIASIEGRQTIKLYAKPPSLRGVDLKDCKRAKAIGDKPFGIMELANDVVIYLSVQKTDAGMVIVADARRVATED